jgi:hypothetical protein
MSSFDDSLTSHFALPLSVEAFQELQEISTIIAAFPIAEDVIDQRKFVWGDKYSPSKYYNFLFEQLPQDQALHAIWESKSMPKLKVFMWLLMIDRLNTRDIMLRKHWHIDSGPECILCAAGMLETRDHLFFDCEFAQVCWNTLNIHWNPASSMSERFLRAKRVFSGPCFVETFACATWNIWKSRNGRIFEAAPASLAKWKLGFQNDLFLHKYRVKTSVVQPLVDWLRDFSV